MGVAGHGWKNGGGFFHLQLDTHHRHCIERLGSGCLRVATCRFSAPHEAFLTESHVSSLRVTSDMSIRCLAAGRKTCWTVAVYKVVEGRSCCTPPFLQKCCRDPTMHGVSWRLNLCARRHSQSVRRHGCARYKPHQRSVPFPLTVAEQF